MTSPDDKGEVIIPADTEGEPTEIRIDGAYLASIVKACGGMVELKLTNAYSPMLFSQNGYEVVCMPMLTTEANEQAKADREAKAQAKVTEQAEPSEAEATTEGEAEPSGQAEAKPKRSRKRDKVAVA